MDAQAMLDEDPKLSKPVHMRICGRCTGQAVWEDVGVGAGGMRQRG